MINKLGWAGEFQLTVKEKGEIKEEVVIKNRITDLALQAIIEILDNLDPDLDIKYLAIGNDNTPLSNSDTQLGNEIFRTQLQSSNSFSTGQFTTVFTILDSEAVGQWEEIGIFCGDSASSTPDSGRMLSRILYSRNKTSLEEIEFTRLDTVARA